MILLRNQTITLKLQLSSTEFTCDSSCPCLVNSFFSVTHSTKQLFLNENLSFIHKNQLISHQIKCMNLNWITEENLLPLSKRPNWHSKSRTLKATAKNEPSHQKKTQFYSQLNLWARDVPFASFERRNVLAGPLLRKQLVRAWKNVQIGADFRWQSWNANHFPLTVFFFIFQPFRWQIYGQKKCLAKGLGFLCR